MLKLLLNEFGPAQVLYNAQMIRTWSLLLRNAQRLNYIVSGRQVGCYCASHQWPCTSVRLSQFLDEG